MSLSAYQKYKNSGVEWLGNLPADWDVVPLKAGFNLKKRPPPENCGVVTAFRDGEVTLRSNRRMDGFTEALQEIGYQGVEPNDLVIHAMDAFAGAIGVSDSRGKSTPVYSVCEPKQEYFSRYYGLVLRHIALAGYIQSLAKGIRERSTDFRWSDAKNIPIPHPSIKEQKIIIDFLDYETAKIDALVAEQEKLIELLTEKRKAVITQAVTKGLNPDVKMKDSKIEWLGNVPEHWDVTPFKWVSKCKSGDGIANLDISDDQDNHHQYPVIGGNGVMGYSDTVNVNRSVIAIGRVGALCGNIHEIKEQVWVSDNALIVEIKSEILNLSYASLVLKSRNLNDIATRTAQPLITGSQVREQRIPIPSLEEQASIVQFTKVKTNEFDDLITKSNEAIDLLQERRSALISAAVTGQIDVRNYKHKEAA